MKQLPKLFSHAAIVLMAVFFTWLTHELAHWVAAVFLGYSPVMTLNMVYLQGETYREDWHQIWVSAAGPVITILQAIAVYKWMMIKGWKGWLFPFLLLALYTRMLAGAMNFINLNDEGRISKHLGIGNYTLSLFVSGFLFYLVYRMSKTYKPGWRYLLVTLVLIMFFSSCLILADNAWHVILLK